MTFDETAWWGDCANTWHEEQKQIVYAMRMGLMPDWRTAHPPTFDAGGASVIDIGGGPCSMLLKTLNRGRSVVMDPGNYPDWVIARYQAVGIEFWRQPGEELDGYTFDEVWIYNTLQHVHSPRDILVNAQRCASTIRLFDWIDIAPYDGHPHMLTEAVLDAWLGGKGFTADLDQDGAVGRAYYGVFQAS